MSYIEGIEFKLESILPEKVYLPFESEKPVFLPRISNP
ncbi:hypothetical protein LEP1GSC137_0131 [Leptospira borgpetersenii str. Noumea 25]|nr:hypothetical protein LEP1GSC137_0131 [Leptospira borgpetersenii str. Noumea 25]